MTRTRIRSYALAGAATLVLTMAPAGLARAATAADAIAALNAQRAANGLPADIAENAAWSSACAQHMNYLRLNNYSGNWHDEIPGNPGYSDAGRQAAQSSVLSSAPWVGSESPFEYAPIHLAQLLGPALSVTGYADGCMWTWPGYQRPAPAVLELYSYPGDGASIYPAMTARESPFVPGDFVGLPEGTTTGPHLYVFAFGGDSGRGSLSGASLTGPEGPVDVRVVDNATGQLGSFLPPGGILIPAAPLRAHSTYVAKVTFTSGSSGATGTRTWSFQTRGLRVAEATVNFDGTNISVSTSHPTNGAITVTRVSDGATVRSYSVPAGGSMSGGVGLPAGRYRACVSHPATAEYEALSVCQEAASLQAETLTTPTPRRIPTMPGGGNTPSTDGGGKMLSGPRLSLRTYRNGNGRRVSIRTEPLGVGRSAQVTITKLRCTGKWSRKCTLRATGTATKRTVKLKSKAVTLKLPHRSVRVTVTLPSFTAGGYTYTRSKVSLTSR
jgi:hypothetical protein